MPLDSSRTVTDAKVLLNDEVSVSARNGFSESELRDMDFLVLDGEGGSDVAHSCSAKNIPIFSGGRT